MVFEFLDSSLGDTGFTYWSLIVVGVIISVGVIVARIARMVFKKKFAPKMTVDSAKNMSKILYWGIIIITLLAGVSSQGVDFTGLIVAGGIFGVVIGFATQSVVSNLISGIFLMIEKPAKQGENVEIPGMNVLGRLIDIGTFSTRIQQFDGTVIRVPNEKVFTSNLRTFALSDIRRSEFTIGIAYKDDIDQAISVMKDAIRNKVTYALMEPEPQFWVTELGDNSVNIKVLVWTPRDDLLSVNPVMLKVLKNALDEAGIEIPFPQRVIWQQSSSK